MKNKNTFKVVMLPTEKASPLFLYNKYLLYGNKITKEAIENKWGSYQNIFFVSDEEPKDGDWCIGNNNDVHKYDGIKYKKCWCKKIIASTDKSLEIKCKELSECHGEYIADNLPSIPESFINAYIKAYKEGKPITEVDLEMECYKGVPNCPKEGCKVIKTRPDGSVIVHQSKMYSKQECAVKLNQILNDYVKDIARRGCDISKYDKFDSNKWIEENL